MKCVDERKNQKENVFAQKLRQKKWSKKIKNNKIKELYFNYFKLNVQTKEIKIKIKDNNIYFLIIYFEL